MYYQKRAKLYNKLNLAEDEINDYTTIINLNPKSFLCVYYFRRAKANIKINKYTIALDDLNTIINIKNENNIVSNEYYHTRGKLLYKLKKYSEALSDLEKAKNNLTVERFSYRDWSASDDEILDRIKNILNAE